MKQQLIDTILTEIENRYPSIADLIEIDSTPYEFWGVYWSIEDRAVGNYWEQHFCFLLLLLAAEGVEVEWITEAAEA